MSYHSPKHGKGELKKESDDYCRYKTVTCIWKSGETCFLLFDIIFSTENKTTEIEEK